MLRGFDFSYADPAENLALDEVLLEYASAEDALAYLRFWESPVPFVVLGVSQRLRQEVREEACAADGVSIQRRCTAGGCVLQGPGSLNFALALPLAHFPEAAGLQASYEFILDRIANALRAHGVPAERQGISDLAVAGRKISGNAQRRRKNAVLHHGTLLYRMDSASLARYLREPEERPAYRGERKHEEFVTAVPLDRDTLVRAVSAAFGLDRCTGPSPDKTMQSRVTQLAAEKYRTEAWARRL